MCCHYIIVNVHNISNGVYSETVYIHVHVPRKKKTVMCIITCTENSHETVWLVYCRENRSFLIMSSLIGECDVFGMSSVLTGVPNGVP